MCLSLVELRMVAAVLLSESLVVVARVLIRKGEPEYPGVRVEATDASTIIF
jgi:hypothetical protein